MTSALRSCAAVLVAAALAGCGLSDSPGDPSQCTAHQPCAFSQAFPIIEVEPGQELSDLCQSWTLDNPEELWVTGVEMRNDGGYHHSNWFFVPDDAFDVPDGVWACSDHQFSELAAAISGGFLFAQSTQSTSEAQRFAQGAAIRIPPYSRVIGATHLLNASDQLITTRANLRIESASQDDVTVKLAPARIEYRDLTIPPNATSQFTTECDLADVHYDAIGDVLDYTIYYVLPHYHELGSHFQLELVGGDRDGEVLYRHEGYGGETFGKAFDPPVDLAAAGATGVRFTCGYTNPRDREVGWGIGDQEMCVLAILADTTLGFQGTVLEGTGGVDGTAADGTVQYSGPCSVLAVPWEHDKPGGPPR